MRIVIARGAQARCGSSWLVWLGVAASVACAGCIRTNFIKSSSSFTEHEAKVRPGVFVDHLPKKAYASVGIIEVIAPATTDLGEIMSAAADKGQEVGCDVVVDRAIHRVDSAGLRRWRVAVAAPAPSPAEAPHHSRADAQYLGYGFSPTPVYTPPPSVAYTPVYTPPPDKREFICGVWSNDDDDG
jgi:hypothetical protein